MFSFMASVAHGQEQFPPFANEALYKADVQNKLRGRPRVIIEEAVGYLRSGEYLKAIGIADKLLRYDRGDGDALFVRAVGVRSDPGVASVSMSDMLRDLNAAVEGASADAPFYLASLHQTGELGVATDIDAAIQLYVRSFRNKRYRYATHHGDPAFALYQIYSKQNGKEFQDTAIGWLTAAVNTKHPSAMLEQAKRLRAGGESNASVLEADQLEKEAKGLLASASSDKLALDGTLKLRATLAAAPPQSGSPIEPQSGAQSTDRTKPGAPSGKQPREAVTLRDDVIGVQDYRNTLDRSHLGGVYPNSKQWPYMAFIFNDPSDEAIAEFSSQLSDIAALFTTNGFKQRPYVAIVTPEDEKHRGILMAVVKEEPKAYSSTMFTATNLSAIGKIDLAFQIRKILAETVHRSLSLCRKSVGEFLGNYNEMIPSLEHVVRLGREIVDTDRRINKIEQRSDLSPDQLKEVKGLENSIMVLDNVRHYVHLSSNFAATLNQQDYWSTLQKTGHLGEMASVLRLCLYLTYPMDQAGKLRNPREQRLDVPREIAVLAGFYSDTLLPMESK